MVTLLCLGFGYPAQAWRASGGGGFERIVATVREAAKETSRSKLDVPALGDCMVATTRSRNWAGVMSSLSLKLLLIRCGALWQHRRP